MNLFDYLPNETLLHLFNYLADVKNYTMLKMTCHRFHDLLNDKSFINGNTEIIWKNIPKKDVILFDIATNLLRNFNGVNSELKFLNKLNSIDDWPSRFICKTNGPNCVISTFQWHRMGTLHRTNGPVEIELYYYLNPNKLDFFDRIIKFYGKINNEYKFNYDSYSLITGKNADVYKYDGNFRCRRFNRKDVRIYADNKDFFITIKYSEDYDVTLDYTNGCLKLKMNVDGNEIKYKLEKKNEVLF